MLLIILPIKHVVPGVPVVPALEYVSNTFGLSGLFVLDVRMISKEYPTHMF